MGQTPSRCSHNLWVDQEKAFLSTQFQALAISFRCNLIPVLVEAYWSSIAEQYHDMLRCINLKVILDIPTAPLSLVLDYAILAISHTKRPEGFTLVILAFGAQPCLSIRNYSQEPLMPMNRMDPMTIARREYGFIVSFLPVRRALHAETPNETVLNPATGDEVLVYRENKGWKDLYASLGRDGLLPIVLVDHGLEHLFLSTMLKP